MSLKAKRIPVHAATIAARASVLCVAAGLLSACGLNQRIDDFSRIDYKSATTVNRASLEVPPDLSQPRADNRYVVPDRGAASSSPADRTFSSYERSRAGERPSGTSVVLPPVEGVRMMRAGNQRWLAVDAPPERLWPVVRDFWQESGFIVQSESPATGIIETDWAENRAKIPLDFIRRSLGRVLENLYSTGERDKFRTRLEAVGNTTEVYISHRGMIEVFTSQREDQTVWQARPNDPELEAEFLRRLMVKLGVSNEQAQAAAAAGITGADRARLINTGAQQVLEVAEGFDRAWRRVGLALDRGGFTVEDRDRSRGQYFVRYIDPEVEGGRIAQKPGFFSRWFGSSKTRADAGQHFRILVAGEGGEQSQVTVQDKDGKPVGEVDRRTAGRILSLLHEQLK